MTVHRWDIAEDNLLAFKVANATFTRCISKQGHAEVQARIRVADRGKVVVVHMGTPLPCIEAAVNAPHPIFTIITPANFVPKKGHIYLIQACALLVARGVRNFRCLLVGRGPLAKRLRDEIGKRKLGSFVRLVGQKPNEELREMYLSGSVDAVVLPSIVTEDGQYEGIPVSLMEAMAACLPVISTRTGAVDELVDPSCGKLVREKDPTALAEAILELMNEPGKAQALGVSARRKIEAEFDDEQIAQTLLAMFEHYAREPV
jgi:glycosyltransferase involved in cell wall biosynthesis